MLKVLQTISSRVPYCRKWHHLFVQSSLTHAVPVLHIHTYNLFSILILDILLYLIYLLPDFFLLYLHIFLHLIPHIHPVLPNIIFISPQLPTVLCITIVLYLHSNSSMHVSQSFFLAYNSWISFPCSWDRGKTPLMQPKSPIRPISSSILSCGPCHSPCSRHIGFLHVAMFPHDQRNYAIHHIRNPGIPRPSPNIQSISIVRLYEEK